MIPVTNHSNHWAECNLIHYYKIAIFRRFKLNLNHTFECYQMKNKTFSSFFLNFLLMCLHRLLCSYYLQYNFQCIDFVCEEKRRKRKKKTSVFESALLSNGFEWRQRIHIYTWSHRHECVFSGSCVGTWYLNFSHKCNQPHHFVLHFFLSSLLFDANFNVREKVKLRNFSKYKDVN